LSKVSHYNYNYHISTVAYKELLKNTVITLSTVNQHVFIISYSNKLPAIFAYTHKECGPRFHPPLHTSYTMVWQPH